MLPEITRTLLGLVVVYHYDCYYVAKLSSISSISANPGTAPKPKISRHVALTDRLLPTDTK